MPFNFVDDWPHETDSGQATIAWAVMNEVVDGGVKPMELGRAVGDPAADSDQVVKNLTEFMFTPLFDFLIEQAATRSSVLNTLYRWVRQLEWFDRDDLTARANATTRNAEGVFDLHLREWMFGDGIDMPFSQARGPSGESDLIAQVGSGDPMACELKLFENELKSKAYVATGLHQAVEYAQDHGLNFAYPVGTPSASCRCRRCSAPNA